VSIDLKKSKLTLALDDIGSRDLAALVVVDADDGDVVHAGNGSDQVLEFGRRNLGPML
jgi:hypothetical protein